MCAEKIEGGDYYSTMMALIECSLEGVAYSEGGVKRAFLFFSDENAYREASHFLDNLLFEDVNRLEETHGEKVHSQSATFNFANGFSFLESNRHYVLEVPYDSEYFAEAGVLAQVFETLPENRKTKIQHNGSIPYQQLEQFSKKLPQKKYDAEPDINVDDGLSPLAFSLSAIGGMIQGVLYPKNPKQDVFLFFEDFHKARIASDFVRNLVAQDKHNARMLSDERMDEAANRARPFMSMTNHHAYIQIPWKNDGAVFSDILAELVQDTDITSQSYSTLEPGPPFEEIRKFSETLSFSKERHK